ncbi:cobalamin B12-binding domain-containing protein [Desulfatibacillum aliphaticivorans]|nr:cobalamin-dependent protein [Desulfatibacillum aliphaticivorans]
MVTAKDERPPQRPEQPGAATILNEVQTMPNNIFSQPLPELVTALKEKEVHDQVLARLERGDDPMEILNECQRGMEGVGLLYEKKEYFISGLIIAAEILKDVVNLTAPHIREIHSGKSAVTVLIGTAQGDIHDLGKDLFITLLQCYGFHIIDLGVDVSPQTFLESFIEHKPQIVGISALLTSVIDAMKETIALIRSEVPQGASVPLFIIGGGIADQIFADMVGADFWTQDAMAGVRFCQDAVKA